VAGLASLNMRATTHMASSELDNIDSSRGGKQKDWHFPRLLELRYPSKIANTQDRHNWIASMMVDSRLNDRNKLVLTRLAMHLNTKTQRCDPTVGLLVTELSLDECGKNKETSAIRSVRLSLEQAEKIGWIKRHLRHGGDTRRNQSSFYQLTIPPDIVEMLCSIGQEDAPERTNGASDRTNTPSREDSAAPLIGKSLIGNPIIGNDKHSVLSERADCVGVALKDGLGLEGKKGVAGEASWKGYNDNEVQVVRDAILDYSLETIPSIIKYSRQMQYFITGNIIGNMIRDGHFGRDGDRIFLLDGEDVL
jgi:hypothetical protein